MLICTVVGARPNFMKVAPVVRALKAQNLPNLLVHTGQHYDASMSQVFFDELGMPSPDFFLGVGGGSHSAQTARVMVEMEKVLVEYRPDMLLVAGDVNSTVAAALTGTKLGIPVGHIEAGLRSFDRRMPEETNRVVTDHLSDLLFTTEASGNENLAREGIPAERIHFVGNCMVDSLLQHLQVALGRRAWEKFGLEPGGYGVVTLHRPSNVDDLNRLSEVVSELGGVSKRMPIVFPVHPRTRTKMAEGQIRPPASIRVLEPLSYLDFLSVTAKARFVLTDSGGIQEETTVLGVPCLTLRENTERPVTIHCGTNRLIGIDPKVIRGEVEALLETELSTGLIPPLWDGRAAERIVACLEEWLSKRTEFNLSVASTAA